MAVNHPDTYVTLLLFRRDLVISSRKIPLKEITTADISSFQTDVQYSDRVDFIDLDGNSRTLKMRPYTPGKKYQTITRPDSARFYNLDARHPGRFKTNVLLHEINEAGEKLHNFKNAFVKPPRGAFPLDATATAKWPKLIVLSYVCETDRMHLTHYPFYISGRLRLCFRGHPALFEGMKFRRLGQFEWEKSTNIFSMVTWAPRLTQDLYMFNRAIQRHKTRLARLNKEA